MINQTNKQTARYEDKIIGKKFKQAFVSWPKKKPENGRTSSGVTIIDWQQLLTKLKHSKI
ncbi:hypothetical protein [Maribacter sp. 2307ULW6-5]|uniref:hypothetical protein n=1 Tax=Maribacter sp. 2307ULW6-5 TaxID=3386275 RepID=UPI0039BD0B8C